MTDNETVQLLKDEGFNDVYIRQDSPFVRYPEHTHAKHTVHFILNGDMTLQEHFKETRLKKGDRFDIAPGTSHSAQIGQAGCRYIVGEK